MNTKQPVHVVRARKGRRGNRSEQSWSNNNRLYAEAKKIEKAENEIKELEQTNDKP